MCTGELIHSKWDCTSSFNVLYFWSVLKYKKNNEVPISAPEEKCFHEIQVDIEFQTGFVYQFNAAWNWLHIHFLWQGTMEDFSAYIWTNVIQKILTHLPNHPSAANNFFKKGPQEAPHPWSPVDCNGMGHMSNRPHSVNVVQKLAFYYHTSLVVHLRVSHSCKFSTVANFKIKCVYKLRLCNKLYIYIKNNMLSYS